MRRVPQCQICCAPRSFQALVALLSTLRPPWRGRCARSVTPPTRRSASCRCVLHFAALRALPRLTLTARLDHAGSAGVRARVSRLLRAFLVSQPRRRTTRTQRCSELSNLPSAYTTCGPARGVLSLGFTRPRFRRARCCGCAWTSQRLATWPRNMNRRSRRWTKVLSACRVLVRRTLTQFRSAAEPAVRDLDDQASASALLAQALADATAATAAAADSARANAALVRDREGLRASLAAEREAARRARAEAQAAEMRASTAAKMLALERSLGGSMPSADGSSACADADAVYAAAISALRQTQAGGGSAAADDVMRALSRAVARGNALNTSVREELARTVASAGAALARATAAEARVAASSSVARAGTVRAAACPSQPLARMPPPRPTPPVPPAPVPPRVFSSLGGIGASRSAAPVSFLRGDPATSALSDGGAFIRSGADGRGGRHTVLVPLLPLAERPAASNAPAVARPPPTAKRPRSAGPQGLERFGFSSS